MTQSKKAFIRMAGYKADASTPAGALDVTIEYKMLTGQRDGGKLPYRTAPISKADDTNRDAILFVCQELSRIYAPEVFHPRDIVGTII